MYRSNRFHTNVLFICIFPYRAPIPIPCVEFKVRISPDLFSPGLYLKYQEALAARQPNSDGGQQLPPAPRQPQIPTSPAALPATPPAPRQPMIVDGMRSLLFVPDKYAAVVYKLHIAIMHNLIAINSF